MLNLVTGILFSVLLFPSNLSNSCDDYWENHPVRLDITMQIVLKSYGYYAEINVWRWHGENLFKY